MGTSNENLNIVIKAKDLGSQALRGVRDRFNRLRQSVVSLKGAMISLGTVFAASRIGQSLIQSFTQQQDAVIGLGAALENTGKGGSEALRELTRNASALQKVVTHGDEAIIAASESLTLLAPSLNTPQLVDAQQALIGIADTFTGGNLNSAAQLLGKTLGSTTNALTRYGIEVDMSGSASERLGQIVEQSGRFFEVSKAKATTLGGSMQQLRNAIGDVKEVLGGILADMLGLTDRTSGLTEKTFGLIDALEQNRGQIVAWGQVAIQSIGFVAQAFRTLIRVAFNIGQLLGRGLEIAWSSVIGVVLRGLETVIAQPLNLIIEQLNRIPGVDIDFRIGGFGADVFFQNVATQAANLRGDISDLGDALGNLAGSWQGVADAAGRAHSAQTSASTVPPPTIPRAAIPFGPLAIPELRVSGDGPKDWVKVGDKVGVLGDALGTMGGAADAARLATEQMAVTTINAFAQMAQAAQRGSGSLLSSLFGGASSILAAIPGMGTIAQAGILAGGGTLSSLFTRGGGNQPLPVTLEGYSSHALSQQQEIIQPLNFTAVVRSGNEDERVVQQRLYRLSRRDASPRILIPIAEAGL